MKFGEKKLLELASRDEIKEAFHVTPLEKQLISEGYRYDQCLEALDVLENTFISASSTMKYWWSYYNFIGKFPYVERHPLLEKILFSDNKVDISDKIIKEKPSWWTQGFPKDTNKLCASLYKLINYNEFDSGKIDLVKFKKFRAGIQSPMDKKVFTKPRLGPILEILNSCGIIDNEFIANFKNRTTNSNKEAKIKVTAHPVDLLRLSTSKTWRSCMRPGGEFCQNLMGLYTDPTVAVMYHLDKTLKDFDMDAPRSRMNLHLMADYEVEYNKQPSTFSTFFNAVCKSVHSKDLRIDEYKVKVKKWYIVLDRLYDSGTQAMMTPFIFLLLQRAKEAGIGVACPSNYNVVQNQFSYNVPFAKKGVAMTLSAPIFHSTELRTYHDNIQTTCDNRIIGGISSSPNGVSIDAGTGIIKNYYISAKRINKV